MNIYEETPPVTSGCKVNANGLSICSDTPILHARVEYRKIFNHWNNLIGPFYTTTYIYLCSKYMYVLHSLNLYIPHSVSIQTFCRTIKECLIAHDYVYSTYYL